MTVQERILALRLFERQESNPDYIKKLGVSVQIEHRPAFCQNEEETRYLADVLTKGNSSYYKNYAARLYQSIGDEDQFLETKLNNLQYASDYLEVARFISASG